MVETYLWWFRRELEDEYSVPQQTNFSPSSDRDGPTSLFLFVPFLQTKLSSCLFRTFGALKTWPQNWQALSSLFGSLLLSSLSLLLSMSWPLAIASVPTPAPNKTCLGWDLSLSLWRCPPLWLYLLTGSGSSGSRDATPTSTRWRRRGIRPPGLQWLLAECWVWWSRRGLATPPKSLPNISPVHLLKPASPTETEAWPLLRGLAGRPGWCGWGCGDCWRYSEVKSRIKLVDYY